MKNKLKEILVILSTVVFPMLGKTQFIAPEIIEKYPSSVVSRIYEVAFVSLIPPEKQIKLAKHFLKKDSLIAAAARNDVSLKSIKTLVDSLQLEFEKIFNDQERFRYNYYKYQNFFEADAAMEAAYVKQRYSTGQDVETSIHKLNISKNQRVLRALISNANFSSLADSNILYYRNYDSIMNKYLIAAEGEKYFHNKVNEMSKVKPIATKEREELEKNFRLQCLKNGANYHQNFNVAMQSCIPDSSYYKALYQDSLNEIAKVIAQKELERLTYKYSLNDESKNKIAPILLDKANKTVWLDTRYQFNKKRDSLQTEVDETSWAKIKKELIQIGYTQLDKSRLITAVKLKDALGLTKAQVDTLIKANLSHDLMTITYKAKNKGASPDFDWFITAYIKDVLTEGQYDSLLLIEAQPQAIANAKQNWFDLKRLKLISGVDSTSAMKQMINYHTSLLVFTERYYNEDRVTYNKLVKSAKQNKPELLKRLDVVKKEEELK